MTTPKYNKVTDITLVIGQQQSEQISFIVETNFFWIKLGGSSTNSFLFFKVKPGQVESNLP